MMPARPRGDQDGFVVLKRRMYLFATLLGIPVDGLGWLWLSEDPAIAAIYGVITIALVGNAVLILLPFSMDVLERISFPVLAVLFVGRLAVVVFLTPGMDVEFGELITSLVVLCCLYVLAFLMYSRRLALLLACAIVAAAGALIVTGLLLVGPQGLPHSGMPLLKAFAMQAILVPLLYVLAVIKEQMSAARVREQVLTEIATTDALTDLPNRRHLTEILDQQVADTVRSGRPLSVVLVDVDRFKTINDTYGHDVGDQVLRHVAEVLGAEVRAADAFGRWGGEEFLLVAVDSDLPATERLAHRLRERLQDRPHPQVGSVTASFGVATLGPATDWEDLFRAADQALYTAKNTGRDQVVVAPEPQTV